MKEEPWAIVPDRHLVVASLNIRGQLTLSQARILQLEDFIKHFKIDILNLQETDLKADSFADNNFLFSNFDLLINNSPKKFGVSTLIKNDIAYDNVKIDTEGRVLSYELSDLEITGTNIYLQSGILKEHKDSRDNYSSKVIPEILQNKKNSSFITGDWNNIISKSETT